MLMTRTLRLSILLALPIAFCCTAVNAAPPGDCLSYEPARVKLTGRVISKVFPGPPNYESVKGGDKPEPAWLLHLAKPICVKADNQDEFNVAVDNVSVIHLVLRGNQFSRLRRLRKKGAVTLTGQLFHSFTGHHHADVLMQVSRIEAP
jgi:hypothetical protein